MKGKRTVQRWDLMIEDPGPPQDRKEILRG